MLLLFRLAQLEEYTAPSEEGLANTTEERATPRIHPITILITLLTLPLQMVALILWCLYYVFTTIHIFTRYRLRTIKAKKRMLRYLQSGSSEDVDAAISYYQHAFIVVHTVEWGRSHSTFALYNLAICLSKRYERRHNLQDVDEAITYCRVALVICPSVDLDYHFEILNTLGGVLKKRYEESGDISELQEAIIRNVEALSLRPHGHSDRPLSLINLSSCFEAHYSHTGDPTGLERAIECGQEALECPPGRVDVCTILSQVASCLSSRHHRTAALQDLEDAIQYYRKVLELEPIGHPQYPVSKGNLGVSLAARYERLGDERDMEEATDCAREVLNLLPAVHPARRMALSNFASCLLAQVWKQYNENDLEEAIHLLHESLSLGTPDSTTLSHLIACLLTRYDQKGNREDMEEAMRVSRQALLCPPLTPTDRPEALRNLVSCLIARFSQENNPEDISEAIKHITEAIDLVPEGSPDAWKALAQLGSCFRVDSMRTGWEISHPEQLDKAIDLHRRALALLSPEQPFRAVALVDYANCLFVRYLKSEDPQELEEVITNCREACRLLPATSSRLHMEAELLLSASLHSRYELFSNIKDLDEAVSAMESGYPGEATSHPALADRMSLLAQLYITVSGLSGQGSRYDDAMQLFQRGVEHSSASVLSRLRIATIWTIHASGTWQLYAYQKALELANRYLLITPAITSRLNMLQSIPPSLVQNAVACALSAGDCKLAIELLEQGRTLLWSQLSRYRAPLEDLEVGNPDLAASFLALSQQLETSAIRSRSGTIGTSGIHHPIEDDAKRYRELSEAWEDTLKQIRSLEGFETFLRPTPFSVLQRAASHGPVIITNISTDRSDIIILRNGFEPILLPLRDVRKKDIDHLASAFSGEVAMMRSGQVQRPKLIAILRRLWDDVVKHVVDCLERAGVRRGSRIWWCPTSQLASLPLHAAGPHKRNQPNLPDLYISSYTSTLSALIRASSEENTSAESPSPRLLLVAQPNAPQEEKIEGVTDEIAQIQRMMPSVDLLLDDEGTVEAVVHGLLTHRWVHFACHGYQNRSQPFEYHFRLHNQSLRLLDIIPERLPHAEFAYLAACHTAAIDERAPDEAIHLAAALQFCGFKSVIGTMYAMADPDGPVVAGEVYRHMIDGEEASYSSDDALKINFRNAAEALNYATRKLKTKGVPIERWINFVHIGA